jgi:hypothetical protein
MAECDRTGQIDYARSEGRTEEKHEIARNLLIEGSTHEFIQKVTGLSLEEVKKL